MQYVFKLLHGYDYSQVLLSTTSITMLLNNRVFVTHCNVLYTTSGEVRTVIQKRLTLFLYFVAHVSKHHYPYLSNLVNLLHFSDIPRHLGNLMDIKTTRQPDSQPDSQTARQSARQTDRHTYIQTDRLTDRQTDRQTHRQTDTQTDRQTDRQTG